MVDSLRVVDEHDEALGPCELECKHLHAGDRAFDGRRDLAVELSFLVVNCGHPRSPHKKWAPRAHFAKPVKMVSSRIATAVAMRVAAAGGGPPARGPGRRRTSESPPRVGSRVFHPPPAVSVTAESARLRGDSAPVPPRRARFRRPYHRMGLRVYGDVNRRQLLVRTGLGLAAAGVGGLEELAAVPRTDAVSGWDDVRAQFRLSRSLIHMGGLYLASHPGAVRRAIDRHRRGLDADPVGYLHRNGDPLEAAVLRAAGSYLAARPTDIALTDSTTMGLGLLYGGLSLRSGDEIVTTTHDFFATHEALGLAAERVGATVRRVPLYRDPARAPEDEIVSNLARAIGPGTRVVALTWVHSSTGVKLPVRRIVQGPGRRGSLLVCVDGVHGLGVENETVDSLGVDF